MNVSFRYGHVNDLANIARKDAAITRTLEWIDHWKRDLQVGLPPTADSLERVGDLLRSSQEGDA